MIGQVLDVVANVGKLLVDSPGELLALLQRTSRVPVRLT